MSRIFGAGFHSSGIWSSVNVLTNLDVSMLIRVLVFNYRKVEEDPKLEIRLLILAASYPTRTEFSNTAYLTFSVVRKCVFLGPLV
jgi:hypothetical protein